MGGNDFPFIVSSGPKLEKDPKIRTLIRKQAMKDIGKKRRGNYSRVNTLQLPTDVQIGSAVGSDSSGESSATTLESPESSDSSERTEATDYDELVPRRAASAKTCTSTALARRQSPPSLDAFVLCSDYEAARSKFGVDVAKLSMLCNFNVGRSSIPLLSTDVSRFTDLISLQQWSYVQYIPSRYAQGASKCLTAATDCVLSKVKSVLEPQNPKARADASLYYRKALRSLNEALSDKTSNLDSDVLCATELLGLHELLDPSQAAAFSVHIKGSARLVQTRTPHRFVDEFDKALFAAHVGPMVTECLLDDQPCYLAQPEWMKLFESLSLDSDYLTDRSSLTIRSRSLMIQLPGLWHDIGEVVNGDGLFDDDALLPLQRRCRHEHAELLRWMEDYKSHVVKMSLATPTQKEIDLRRELLGAVLECLCIAKRLLATVCDDERTKLETEVQAIAHLIIDLQKQPSPSHSWLFAGHEVGVAYTIILTKDDWEGTFFYDSEYESRMAQRMRYNTWTTSIRMPR